MKPTNLWQRHPVSFVWVCLLTAATGLSLARSMGWA